MGVVIAAGGAALALLTLHWFPWELLLRRPLPRLAAYTLGTLALALPLTGLFLSWDEARAALALWIVIGVGGASVAGAWKLDRLMERRLRREEELELLRMRLGQGDERK